MRKKTVATAVRAWVVGELVMSAGSREAKVAIVYVIHQVVRLLVGENREECG